VCPHADRLQNEVQAISQKLAALTSAQPEEFQQGDNAWFMRLDTELKFTVGEKERRNGSLRNRSARPNPIATEKAKNKLMRIAIAGIRDVGMQNSQLRQGSLPTNLTGK
jgi:hypothetical protein